MPTVQFHAYLGPNRRSDLPVVEVRLVMGADDRDAFGGDLEALRRRLRDAGALTPGEHFPPQPPAPGHAAWYASILAQTALLFQQRAGHAVRYFDVRHRADRGHWQALVEHAHADVGLTAVKLAAEMLNGRLQKLAGPFEQFCAFARSRAPGPETRAIQHAAALRHIPVLHLDRNPCIGLARLPGAMRSNGHIWLGQGCRGAELDGTFSPDRTAPDLHLLVDDEAARRELLRHCGLPLVRDDPAGFATRLYAVAIGDHSWWAQDGPEGFSEPQAALHPSLGAALEALHERLGRAPLGVTMALDDLSAALDGRHGGVMDFDLAPKLDRITVPGAGLDRVAERLVDWLIPGPGNGRIPLVAVTGTNGKTTTTRMIWHCLMQAGLRPAMTNTDGVWIGNRQVARGDRAGVTGHAAALTQRDADCAVLETNHSNLLAYGLLFDWCDVAVCLNVSEDHLGQDGVESVEQMAVLKRSLPQRARCAAVLNGDDPRCLAMAPHMQAETVCLVTRRPADHAPAAALACGESSLCCLETIDRREWIVMHYQGRTEPVVAVSDIPATFDGLAHFNVSNAQHAAAALFHIGIGTDAIAAGLSCFESSLESTPGRVNVFDDLPFRVIMDFAHNPDGVRRLTEFVHRLDVKGRRLIALAGSGGRSATAYRHIAAAVAGHYDHYFCKEYAPPEGQEPRRAAPLMRDELLTRGVAPEQTDLMTYGRDVIYAIFDRCGPGDLLIMLMGHVEKRQLPGYIRDYARDRGLA